MSKEAEIFTVEVYPFHVSKEEIEKKGEILTVKRVKKSYKDGLCKNCVYGGCETFLCRAAKVDWDRRDVTNPRMHGFDERYDTSEVLECNFFKSKYIRPEGDDELTTIKQEFFDLGYWAEVEKTSDIESGEYHIFHIETMPEGKRVVGGARYNITSVLKEELKKLKPKEVEFVQSVENDKFTLDVFECKCGFHMGIDSSYLEQVEDVKIACPSCGEIIDTSKFKKGE